MQRKIKLLAVAVALFAAKASDASTISITDNPIAVTGISGTDYQLYKQVGSTLVADNTVTPASVLSGAKTQSAPGGNVHLYASGDSVSLAGFQTSPHIALSGTLGVHTVSVSNLTGTDWFTTPSNTYTTAYGAPTLANQWFNDFFSFYNFNGLLTAAGYTPTQIALERAGLYAGFLSPPSGPGGFQHLSTTSVSYVQEDTTTNQLLLGIADTDGYLYPQIVAYVQATAPKVLALPQFPSDVYASKVVDVSIDGQAPSYLYSFSSVPSGLSTGDSTNSYNLEFQVGTAVPEPATAWLLISVGGGMLLRRRKTQAN